MYAPNRPTTTARLGETHPYMPGHSAPYVPAGLYVYDNEPSSSSSFNMYASNQTMPTAHLGEMHPNVPAPSWALSTPAGFAKFDNNPYASSNPCFDMYASIRAMTPAGGAEWSPDIRAPWAPSPPPDGTPGFGTNLAFRPTFNDLSFSADVPKYRVWRTTDPSPSMNRAIGPGAAPLPSTSTIQPYDHARALSPANLNPFLRQPLVQQIDYRKQQQQLLLYDRRHAYTTLFKVLEARIYTSPNLYEKQRTLFELGALVRSKDIRCGSCAGRHLTRWHRNPGSGEVHTATYCIVCGISGHNWDNCVGGLVARWYLDRPQEITPPDAKLIMDMMRGVHCGWCHVDGHIGHPFCEVAEELEDMASKAWDGMEGVLESRAREMLGGAARRSQAAAAAAKAVAAAAKATAIAKATAKAAAAEAAREAKKNKEHHFGLGRMLGKLARLGKKRPKADE